MDSVIHSLKTNGQIDFVDLKRMCVDSVSRHISFPGEKKERRRTQEKKPWTTTTKTTTSEN